MNDLRFSESLSQRASWNITQNETSNLYTVTIVDWIAYQLPVLVNEYLEFSMVNGFVSAIFIKTINSMGEPLDSHLNNTTDLGFTLDWILNKECKVPGNALTWLTAILNSDIRVSNGEVNTLS